MLGWSRSPQQHQRSGDCESLKGRDCPTHVGPAPKAWDVCSHTKAGFQVNTYGIYFLNVVRHCGSNARAVLYDAPPLVHIMRFMRASLAWDRSLRLSYIL